MRGWCARARTRQPSPPPATCASTAGASMRRAARCGRATWSRWRSTVRSACSESWLLQNAAGLRLTPARCVRRSNRPRAVGRNARRRKRMGERHRPVRAANPCLPKAHALVSAPESSQMTYVVVESCIKCKYMDCVEVCPVDCFYEGENMLVIHPDECIDCGVCEPECPVEAIKPDTEPGLENLLKINAEFAKTWPNITQKKEPPADAKAWEGVPNKLETHFSPNPGTGD